MRTEKLYGNRTHVENVYMLFMNSPGSTTEHLKSQMSGVTDSCFRKIEHHRCGYSEGKMKTHWNSDFLFPVLNVSLKQRRPYFISAEAVRLNVHTPDSSCASLHMVMVFTDCIFKVSNVCEKEWSSRTKTHDRVEHLNPFALFLHEVLLWCKCMFTIISEVLLVLLCVLQLS